MNKAPNYWAFVLKENRGIGAVINTGTSNLRMFESLHREGKIVHIYEGPDKAYAEGRMVGKRKLMDALPELKDRPLAGLLEVILPEAMPKEPLASL